MSKLFRTRARHHSKLSSRNRTICECVGNKSRRDRIEADGGSRSWNHAHAGSEEWERRLAESRLTSLWGRRSRNSRAGKSAAD